MLLLRSIDMRWAPAGALALALALAAGLAPPAAAAPPPFVPIHKQTITVPARVQVWLPTWTPDGRQIVFQNQVNGTTWITGAHGSGTHCISCGFADRPRHIVGGFTYAFPDGRRLFISKELGSLGGGDDPADADAYVLECAPSIVRCASHRYLPVDMSADKGSELIVQRRTWHLAPDGVHLGWTDLRLDGTVMIVARLQRRDGRYVAADPRVVNPRGPRGPDDHNATRWEHASQLLELKSFVDGGRSILAVGGMHSNTDVYKIDLRTGRTTRQTANRDWDEDGALSPDGDLEALYSWRTRHRLDAMAWIPQLHGFANLEWFAALAPFYVSTWQGFQCDLSPWLLPASGDHGGSLIGQPLETYSGNLTPGNNLSGNQFWSPDSTRVLLQERLRSKPPERLADANEQIDTKGLAPNRIAIARIDRRPRRPRRAVSSEVGPWAPPAATFAGTLSSDRTAVVHGRSGGSATITYRGDLRSGGIFVRFDHFTDDGRTFVDGTLSGSTRDATTEPWLLKAEVRVTGAHHGRMRADLVVNNNHKPLPAKHGTFTAVYDGERAPALPALGPCHSKLPQRTRLQVSRQRRGRRVRLRVSADIAGDRRPVRGALVRARGRTLRTDRRGRASLRFARAGVHRIRVTAGDTFRARRVRVRIR